MPVETDSPDHGRGNPEQPDVEEPARPAPAADAAPAHTTTDEPRTDPPPPPNHFSASGGNGGRGPMGTIGQPRVVLPPPVGPPLPGPPVGPPRSPELDAAAGLPSPFARPAPAPAVRRPPRRRRAQRAQRAQRPGRGQVEGRRVVHRLRQVSPWSVFKVVVLFYLCVFLMFMVAGVLLWRIGRSTETIDQFEGLVTRLGAYGQCVPEAEVDPGTDFETDDDCPDGEVIVDGFKLNDGTLFRAALLAGGIFVVAGTAVTILLTILLNLLNDVTGGVRYETLRETSTERSERSSGSPPGPDPGPPAGRDRGFPPPVADPMPTPASRSIGP